MSSQQESCAPPCARRCCKPWPPTSATPGRHGCAVRDGPPLPAASGRPAAGAESAWPAWSAAAAPAAGATPAKRVDFFDAKGLLDFLFDRLSLTPAYEDAEDFALLPGRSGVARLEGQRLALVGQVHPRVAAAFDIEQDVFLFKLDLEALLPHTGKPRRYQPLSRFPSVEEDIAIVVDEGVPAAQVQTIIESSSLVQHAILFDVYTGQPVPAGKKSLAYSMAYQSLEHTLTDAEVQRERRRILERLSRQVGAVLRG